MRLLLDTHTLIWFLSDDRRLSQASGALIENPENSCAISVATPWEMAIKIQLGALRLPYGAGRELRRLLEANRIEILYPEPSDFDALAALPRHHGDPFDRLIAVMTEREGRTLISVDTIFDRYGVRRIAA